MADSTPGTTPVTDHRVPPRGVLPRHAQTWLMIAVALGILGIIVFTGDPAPAASTVAAAPAPVSAPNAGRLRDYQDRLRVLDERARQQVVTEPEPQPLTPPPAYGYDRTTGAPDPLVDERRRREYESLFASNVVLSRRPGADRLATGESGPIRRGTSLENGLPTAPTIDEVADAVVRATSRLQPATASPAEPSITPSTEPSTARTATASARSQSRPVATGPISSLGPFHPVLEGTLIDAVLTNRLDGSVSAPVNCLVTNPVYSHDGRHVLIPAGARVLGETHPVQTFGETRLAVSFNRLVMPDGRTHRLDQFMGLNDIGDAGLRDQVNQHYKSTFGASAAVGLLSGFAQYLGTGAFNRGGGDRTVIITGGVGDAAAQSTAQVMNRYLNRPPSITIREGHRVKVYVTSDFELPPYNAGSPVGGSMLAEAR
ncbi:MAG: TrbI/VirB10 family protein [Acidobacteria bacterium]|nr:TrbI/VirB10 family protein [Acidobacteriota bacterium]